MRARAFEGVLSFAEYRGDSDVGVECHYMFDFNRVILPRRLKDDGYS